MDPRLTKIVIALAGALGVAGCDSFFSSADRVHVDVAIPPAPGSAVDGTTPAGNAGGVASGGAETSNRDGDTGVKGATGAGGGKGGGSGSGSGAGGKTSSGTGGGSGTDGGSSGGGTGGGTGGASGGGTGGGAGGGAGGGSTGGGGTGGGGGGGSGGGTGGAAAPVVGAGADIVANAAVTRTGTASDTLSMTYQWQKVSGPGNVIFSNPTALTTNISADTAGQYVIQLTATATDGQVGSAQINFTWVTSPPTAPTTLITTVGSAAGTDTRYGNSTSPYLVWSGASDPVAGIRDYTVTWFEGANCTGPSTVVNGVTATDLQINANDGDVISFEVAANNNAGLSATSACSQSLTIDVTPPVDNMTLSAVKGFTVETIDLTVTFGSTADYHLVTLSRAVGATPPPCGTGTVVKIYQEGAFVNSGANGLVDDTPQAGQTYSYQLCIADRAGNVTTGHSVSNVKSKPHILFITSDDYMTNHPFTANFGGLSGADAICTQAAGGGDSSLVLENAHGASWRAVLSDSTMDAQARVVVTGTVVASFNLYTLAADRADLWTNGIAVAACQPTFGSPPNICILDESQGTVSYPYLAWTGSSGTGMRTTTLSTPESNCLNWSSNSAGQSGHTGDASNSGQSWLDGVDATCDQSRSLLCISQPAILSTLGLTSFTASPGAVGTIALSATLPSLNAKYDHINLMRVGGPSAPDAACGTGYLTTIGVASTAATYVDTGVVSSNTYSYRACVFDQFQNILTSSIATGVVAP